MNGNMINETCGEAIKVTEEQFTAARHKCQYYGLSLDGAMTGFMEAASRNFASILAAKVQSEALQLAIKAQQEVVDKMST